MVQVLSLLIILLHLDHRNYHVETMGGLDALLPLNQADRDTIATMIITGKINSADITTLNALTPSSFPNER